VEPGSDLAVSESDPAQPDSVPEDPNCALDNLGSS
jgi:hypothetical protein